MKSLRYVLVATSGLFALAAAGNVRAECNPDPETGALYTLEQGGQGNLACFDMQASNSVMMEVPDTGIVMTAPSGKFADWNSGNVDIDVILVEAADGRRCNYFIRDGVTSGVNLTPGGNKSIKNVTLCADGIQETSSAPPPEPISTAEGCVDKGTGTFQVGVNGNPEFRHVIAVGQDPVTGRDNLALCSANDDGQPSQLRCVDRCIRPEGFDPANPPSDTDPDCQVPDADGRFPLKCRVCELASIEPNDQGFPYCWEFSHQVVETAPAVGTFKPPTEETPGWVRWTKYNGSTCFKFTTNFFGIEYSYWTPAGCPGS